MTKKLLLSLTLLLASVGMMFAQKQTVIFETDMGNDVDDALAIDMLYKWHRSGRIDLQAVMLNKEGDFPPRFIDMLNRWYGCKDVAIGVSQRKNNSTIQGKEDYTQQVCQMKDDKGRPLYKQLKPGKTNWKPSVELYRRLLSRAKAGSITIVSVGFSNNLADLLASPADKFSPLTGKELVAEKVDRLVVMAGHMEDRNYREFNVWNDIPSCQKVYSEWPTPIITSPFELGLAICYPAKSIDNDFAWTDHHPICDAYHFYLPKIEDRPTWDLTAVLYAIEPGTMFTLSQPGRIVVTDEGCTHFTPDAQGRHYYITADKAQRQQILDYFVQLITRDKKEF